MSSKQSSSTHATPSQVVTLDDAPRMPTLRLVLRTPKHKQNLWDALKRYLRQSKDSNNFKLIAEKDKERILKQIEHYGYFSKEDINLLNQEIKVGFWEVFEKFKEDILKVLIITEDDEPEVVLAKMDLTEKVVQFIKELSTWMVRKIDELLQIEDMKERRKQTDKFFDRLDNILKEGWEKDVNKDTMMPSRSEYEPMEKKTGHGPFH